MMDWAEVNAHQDIKHDRLFLVPVRPHQDGEKRFVDVRLIADEIAEMAQHGPLVPQMNATAINRAHAMEIGGFQWWGDPIEETVAQ